MPGSRFQSSALVFLHPGARTEGARTKKVMSLHSAVLRGTQTEKTESTHNMDSLKVHKTDEIDAKGP